MPICITVKVGSSFNVGTHTITVLDTARMAHNPESYQVHVECNGTNHWLSFGGWTEVLDGVLLTVSPKSHKFRGSARVVVNAPVYEVSRN